MGDVLPSAHRPLRPCPLSVACCRFPITGPADRPLRDRPLAVERGLGPSQEARIYTNTIETHCFTISYITNKRGCVNMSIAL